MSGGGGGIIIIQRVASAIEEQEGTESPDAVQLRDIERRSVVTCNLVDTIAVLRIIWRRLRG